MSRDFLGQAQLHQLRKAPRAGAQLGHARRTHDGRVAVQAAGQGVHHLMELGHLLGWWILVGSFYGISMGIRWDLGKNQEKSPESRKPMGFYGTFEEFP